MEPLKKTVRLMKARPTMTEQKTCEQRAEELLARREIAHTMLHRMSFWQKIWLFRTYRYFEREYDHVCELLAKLKGVEDE